MKIVYSNFKKGEAKVRTENLDDLWCLNQIVDEGDIVRGETVRKVKIGDGERQDIVRRTVFLSVKVEKTEFSRQNGTLRVLGIVTEGPEDVPHGTHHSFSVDTDTTVAIIKQRWPDYQIQRLEEASEDKQQKILLVVFDREEAYFALAGTYGYTLLGEMKGNIQKKDEDQKVQGTFYADLVKQIQDYVQRYAIERIVVASPAFWKEYLLEEITDPALKKKIISATCSDADPTAFNEVLKRPEVETALKESRAVEEINLVEDVLKQIMQGGAVSYGLAAVKDAAETGAVKTVLITDTYIQKAREENTFSEAEGVLKLVEQSKGTVKIISGEHDGGKKLDGLGGIAALLRYRLE